MIKRLSNISFLHHVEDAALGLQEKKIRTVLTSMGTVVGVALWVGMMNLGLASNLHLQRTLLKYQTSEISIKANPEHPHSAQVLTQNVLSRVRLHPDVLIAALSRNISARLDTISYTETSIQKSISSNFAFVGADPQIFDYANASFWQGRALNTADVKNRSRVIVLGSALASKLGAFSVSNRPRVLLNGVEFEVIGIMDSVDRDFRLMTGAVMPLSTASEVFGAPQSDSAYTLDILVRPGTAAMTSREIPFLIKPDSPDSLISTVAPDPQNLTQEISDETARLFKLFGLMSLLVGGVVAANMLVNSVYQRVGEIGLRRALGATRKNIMVQFLLESSALGLFGGALGALVGNLGAIGIEAAMGIPIAIEPLGALQGMSLGLAVGIAGGIVPALMAARITPVAALRSY